MKKSYQAIKSKIEHHKRINPDATGWLMIPGTNINHPVVQAAYESDNIYYNERNLYGEVFPGMNWQNFADTTIFRDFRVVNGETWGDSSRNTAIYGHNWTNWSVPYAIGNIESNTMLAQLPSFTNLDFARANPYIYYSDDKKEGIWKVFAVATVEVSSEFDYIAPNPPDEQYNYLLTEWKARSRFNYSVNVNTDDRILTLSTCTNEHPVPGTKQRMVVVARLLRPGENVNDVVAVRPNPNAKAPVF